MEHFERSAAHRDQAVRVRPELLPPELLLHLWEEAFDHTTGRGFQGIDVRAHRGVGLRAKQEVDMVGLAVELPDLDAMKRPDLAGHRLDLIEDGPASDDLTAVLHHQDQVMVQAEDRMVVGIEHSHVGYDLITNLG